MLLLLAHATLRTDTETDLNEKRSSKKQNERLVNAPYANDQLNETDGASPLSLSSLKKLANVCECVSVNAVKEKRHVVSGHRAPTFPTFILWHAFRRRGSAGSSRTNHMLSIDSRHLPLQEGNC